jgi:hypothetical protein
MTAYGCLAGPGVLQRRVTPEFAPITRQAAMDEEQQKQPDDNAPETISGYFTSQR